MPVLSQWFSAYSPHEHKGLPDKFEGLSDRYGGRFSQFYCSSMNKNSGQTAGCQLQSKMLGSQNDRHLLQASSKYYQCICQLCSCGKHRCPRPHVNGDFETSYNSQYKPIHHKFAVSQPPPYQFQDRHYNPDALKTRYKETFANPQPYDNQELNTSRLQNIGRNIVRPHIPFLANSSYTEHYKPFDLKIQPNPEDPYLNTREKILDYGFHSPAKLEDKTAYREYFAPPSPQKVRSYPHPEYKKPQVPFYGSSSYKQEFKEFKLAPSNYESYFNQAVSSAPKVKFEGNTTYKDLFKDFKIQGSLNAGGNKCSLEGAGYPQNDFIHSSSPHTYIQGSPVVNHNDNRFS